MKIVSICLGICLVLSLSSVSLALESKWPGNLNDAYRLVDTYGKDISKDGVTSKLLQAGDITIAYVKSDCEMIFLVRGPFMICYCNTHETYAIRDLRTGEQEEVTDPEGIAFINEVVGKMVKMVNESLGLET